MTRFLYGLLLVGLISSSCSAPYTRGLPMTVSEPPESALLRGYYLELSGRDVEAVKQYVRYHNLVRGDTTILVRMASLMLTSGNTREFLTLMNGLLNSPQDTPEYYYLAGNYFLHLQDYPRALKYFQKAIAADPKNVDLRELMGTVYSILGRYPEAIDQLEPVLLLDPSNTQAMLRLAEAYARTGHHAKASRIYEFLASIEPDNPYINHLLGILYLESGEKEKARERLESAVKSDPLYVPARISLGKFYMSSSNPTAAAEQFREAVNFIEVPSELVSIYKDVSELNDTETMILLLEKLTSYGKEFAVFNVVLGRLYIIDGEIEKAVSTFERLKATPYMDASLYALNGMLKVSLDRYTDAIPDLETSIRLSLDDTGTIQKGMVYENLGMVYDQVGRPEKARDCYQKLIDMGYGTAHYYNYVAYSLALKDSDLDTALLYANKALELRPGNAFYLDTRGWVHFKGGRLEEALRDIELALESRSNDPEILEHKAVILYELGRTREAMEIFESLSKHNGNRRLTRWYIERYRKRQRYIR